MHIFRCFDVMKKIISFGDSVMKGIVTGKIKKNRDAADMRFPSLALLHYVQLN